MDYILKKRKKEKRKIIIKKKITNAELGMIGSLIYFGLILGSFSGGYFFSKYASKWLVITSLFVFAFFLYSFTLLQSCGGMYLCRTGCGFCEVFCCIYFPIWVDQYGVKGYKVIWITFLQLGVPVGTILGYIIEAFLIGPHAGIVLLAGRACSPSS